MAQAVLRAFGLLAVISLAGCDIFDSIDRPEPEIHMYGSAVDSITFDEIPAAHIVLQIGNGKPLVFTGHYDALVPVNRPLVLTATAPGYEDFRTQTILVPQGSDDLRSPLLMRRAE